MNPLNTSRRPVRSMSYGLVPEVRLPRPPHRSRSEQVLAMVPALPFRQGGEYFSPSAS